MTGTLLKVGSTELARRSQAVTLVDRTTGEPISISGTIDPDGLATEAKQDDIITNTDRAADALEAMEADTTPASVVGFLNTIAVTPTVEATPDYSTGDVIGGVMTFAAILRADTKTAYAVSVRLTSKVAAASMAAVDVYIFNANPSGSTVTENNAFSLADADRAKLKGKIAVSTWDVVGAAVSAAYAEGRVPITGAAADDVFVVMVARGTINLGSTSDLTVELTVDQN